MKQPNRFFLTLYFLTGEMNRDKPPTQTLCKHMSDIPHVMAYNGDKEAQRLCLQGFFLVVINGSLAQVYVSASYLGIFLFYLLALECFFHAIYFDPILYSPTPPISSLPTQLHVPS